MTYLAALVVSLVVVLSGPVIYLPLIVKGAGGAPATSTPTPTATATATSTATPTGTPAPNCAAAYPTVCIPPPPPDLDCGEIPFRDFTVLPPDPHRFDTDGDGIGCESGGGVS